jgi:DNA-binding beta-propeller fold protein YncE
VDANGKPVLDDGGKVYQVTSDADGNYRFERTPRGANLIVRVELPESVGPMLAYLPTAAAGAARTADVNGASTLVMGYILEKFVKQQENPQATLQKLTPEAEAETRTRAANAIGDELPAKGFKADALVPAVDELRARDAGFDAQVKVVEKMLVAGLADVGEDQLGTDVGLAYPRSLAYLSDGSLVFAERNGHRVRRLDLVTNRMTTLAGKDGALAVGDGGPASEAFIDRPVSIAVAKDDTIYVADFGHNTLRRIDGKTRVITTVAGDGRNSDDDPNGTLPDGLPGPKASFHNMVRVAVDANDRAIFQASQGVFRIESDGRLKLLNVPAVESFHALTNAPDGTVYGYEHDRGLTYKLEGDDFKLLDLPPYIGPFAGFLQAAADGSFYLSDGELLLKLAPGAKAWEPLTFSTRHGDLAQSLIAADGILVGDSGMNRIWKLPLAGGEATPIAGTDSSNADALEADKLSLNRPTSLVIDPAGNLLVADGLNSVIWQRRPDGKFYRFAGGKAAKPGETEVGDGGPARDALLHKVLGMTRLRNGTLLFFEAEEAAGQLREIAPDGTITSRPTPEGMLAPALFTEEADGSILVSDFILKKLFRMKGKNATPIEGLDQIQRAGATALVPDGEGYYLTDVDASAIYLVQDGKPSLVVGGNGSGFAGDGGPASAAKLDHPIGLLTAPNGDLYISDTRNDRIRRVKKATGTIETVAGAGGLALNGSTPDDSIKEPLGLALDTDGNLYISDSGHNQIKRVEAAKLK